VHRRARLVHAAGLSNAEHGQDDIFFGFPQLRTGAQTIARIRDNWGARIGPLQPTSFEGVSG